MANQYTDAKINEILLSDISGRKEANIIDQVKHIDIFESMMSPVWKADIYIQDNVDLIGRFPLLGEEIIRFDIESPRSKKRSFELYVYSIVGTDTSDNKTYVLKCATAEAVKSSGKNINGLYTGSLSDSVAKIFSEVSDEKIFSEQSKGIREILIPNLKPLQAIDFMRQRVVSIDNESSSFCFYKNMYGTHFKTLEGVMKGYQGKAGDKVFFYEDNKAEDITTSQYRGIVALEHPRSLDVLDNLSMGLLKNKVMKYDPITGEVKEREYDKGQFSSGSSTSSLNSKGFLTKYSSQASKRIFLSDAFDSDRDEKIGYLRNFLSQIMQSIIRAHVNGDTELTVGDLVELNIPSGDRIDKTNDLDKTKSGNYVVTKLRHMITPGLNTVYSNSFEAIRIGNKA